MDKGPLISIIVPVYNNDKYIKKCVDSLVNQTYANLQIILINDGSTDKSHAMIKDFEKADNRIVCIDKKNEGLSATRNVGIKASTGDYLMFVDSDDWIDENCCGEVLAEAIASDADVVMWSYVREYENKSLKKPIYHDRVVFNDANETMYIRQLGLLGKQLSNPENMESLNPACTKLYKASIIKQNDIVFIDTFLIGTEDALFNLYVYRHCNRVVYLDKYYYHYLRVNAVSLTKSYKPRLYDQWQKLFSMMKSDIDTHLPSYNAYLALNNRIALSIIGLGLNVHRSNQSLFKKVKEIDDIIGKKLYTEAYRTLELKYFKAHWKLFFMCTKVKFSFGVYILLGVINKIVGR
jgi:glycosyltransferase involved in cell wall biosynthesis